MKKWIALMLCLLLAVGCFTGCDKEESAEVTEAETVETAETAEPAETEAQTEATVEGQTLSVYTDLTEEAPDYAAYMEKVAEFEEATGATVKVSHFGENLSVVLDGAITDGTVDVFSVENLTELRMRMGNLLDLSAYAEGYEAAYPVLMELVRTGDAVYGLPTNANVTAMWYNKAAFEKAGVTETPKTAEEFEALCETLAEAGYRPIALDSAYVHANFGIHMERALGAEALTGLMANGGWTENKAAVEALQTVIDWVNAGYFDENAPVDWPFSQLGLADRTVMIYADESTLEIAEEMIGQDLEWGCFAYPGESKTVLADCAALCVNAETLVPDLAWEYVSFMAAGDAGEAAEILSAADGICDPTAVVKSGPELTGVIESLYAGTYADGAEAAAALDGLY